MIDAIGGRSLKRLDNKARVVVDHSDKYMF